MLFFDKNTNIFCNFANGFLYFFLTHLNSFYGTLHWWVLASCVSRSSIHTFCICTAYSSCFDHVDCAIAFKAGGPCMSNTIKTEQSKNVHIFCCSIDSVAFNMHKSVVHSV